MRRCVPYSKEKVKKIDSIGYWKMCIKQMKGESIDEDLLARKKENANLEESQGKSIEEAKQNLDNAKIE